LNWWEGENRNQFIAGSPCSLVASSRRRVVNVLRMISPESWVCHQPCGLGDAHSLRLNRESIVNRNGSFVNRYSV
jgi:hypothetical protein